MAKTDLNALLNEAIQDERKLEENLMNMTAEELEELLRQAQPYKSLGTAPPTKQVLCSVSNLRETYLKKFLMTGLSKYLQQMATEWTIENEDLNQPPVQDDFLEELPSEFSEDDKTKRNDIYLEFLQKKYDELFPNQGLVNYADMETILSEEDLLDVNVQTNQKFKELTTPVKKLNAIAFNEAIEAAIQNQSNEEKQIINRFINRLFVFDEQHHEQKGSSDIIDDPEREECKFIAPPNDTFVRFDKYVSINHDTIRDLTKNLYNVKPDLEHAMIVYDVVDSPAEAEKWIAKNGSTSKFDIISFNLNTWTLLGDFKQNRERIEYYNKHNQIIKKMLEQAEKDNVLGEDMLKKRVKTQKVKSTKVFGKDDEKLKAYQDLAGVKIDNLEDDTVQVTTEAIIDSKGVLHKTDEDGDPVDLVEVPVIEIKQDGSVEKTKFFTEQVL